MGGKTPRFRKDLEAATVESDGVAYVEVRDQKAGKEFRFYELEYAVAVALDGRDLADVATGLRQSAGMELSVEQLEAFAEQLEGLGFLEPPAAATDFFPPLVAEESGFFDASQLVGELEEEAPAREPTPAPIESKPLAEPSAPEAAAPGGSEHESQAQREAEAKREAQAHAKREAQAHAKREAQAHAEREAAAKREAEAQAEREAAAEADTAEAGPADEGPTPAPVAEAARERTLTAFPPELSARPAGDKLGAAPGAQADSGETSPEPMAAAHRAGAAEGPDPVETVFGPVLDEVSAPIDISALAGKTAEAVPEPVVPEEASPTQVFPPFSPIESGAGDEEVTRGAGDEVEAPPDLLAPSSAPAEPNARAPTASELRSDFAEEPATAELSLTDIRIAGELEGAESTAAATDDTTLDAAGIPPLGRPGPAAPDSREFPTRRLRAVSDLEAEGGAENADAAGDVHDLEAPPPPAPEVSPHADAHPTAAPPTAAAFPAPSRFRLPPSRTVYYAGFGVAAALVVAAVSYFLLARTEPPPVAVKAIVPSPTSVYRFWPTKAQVQQGNAETFSFGAAGQVADLVPPGTTFAAGDVLGLLEGGQRYQKELDHNRGRLAHYERRLERMTEQGNRAEIRQSEIKVAQKKRFIEKAQERLGKHAIVATQSGEVAEVLVEFGTRVTPGQAVLRAKGSAYAAAFAFDKQTAVKARQLGFCKVRISGEILDCGLSAEGGANDQVLVELPDAPVVRVRTTVELARDRLDAVFPVPDSALVKVGESYRVFVVAPGDRARKRVVAVADQHDGQAMISQGLDVGDRVISSLPKGLEDGRRVLLPRP